MAPGPSAADRGESPWTFSSPTSLTPLAWWRWREGATILSDAGTRSGELKGAGYEIFIGALSVLWIVNLVLMYAISRRGASSAACCRIGRAAPERRPSPPEDRDRSAWRCSGRSP